MLKIFNFPPYAVSKRLVSGLLFLTKFTLFNAGKLRKLSRAKRTERRYVRPPRRFALTDYHPGMRYYSLKEKFLRPTRYCNSLAPEIIAQASQLGAYQKPDWEYAESAFEFVKRNITIEMIPLDRVEDTLHRGTGTCLHRLSLLIALCRVAGIRSRYKLYSLTYMDNLDQTIDSDETGKQWNNELGSLLIHGEAELWIDNRWVVGNVGLTAERQASLNLPITRFGEDSLGILYQAYPESIVQLESIPFGIDMFMKILARMIPRAIDNANANLLAQCRVGRAILEKEGEKAYDAQARKAVIPRMPEAIMEERKEITFQK